MKKGVRLILTVYCLLFFSILVYVPWSVKIDRASISIRQSTGYSFIWDPPNRFSTIDRGRLLGEIVILSIVMGASLFAVRRWVR